MNDIEIAQSVEPLPIEEIASRIGIPNEAIHPYGKSIGKVSLSLIDPSKMPHAKLVLVTAITPTPAGEGKTTVTIGLTDGLNRIGKKAVAVLREPSLGPVFGIKGGATGGGRCQVIPMEKINLHFTGDFAAIEKAHNLLAALIDNELHHRQMPLRPDPRRVLWKRVIDMNDRSLRHTIIGLGGRAHGVPRESGFDITAASEVMAIFCLSRSIEELKHRLGNILVGLTRDGHPVTASDLKAVGAMAVLLRDAFMPNLVQTLEHNPTIIHGGPFANIAQGTNSIVATYLALSTAPYVITEAGFGSDLGAEKFVDIICPVAGFNPHAIVLVATTRALKYHGGADADTWSQPDMASLQKGLINLRKHIDIIRQYGIQPIVAINRFATDTDDEIQAIIDYCSKLQTRAVTFDGWAHGGEGAQALAETVLEQLHQAPGSTTPLYSVDQSIPEKISTIARRIYGAEDVEYSDQARKDLRLIERLGLQHLRVCIAKTQKAITDNPRDRGIPKPFTLHIRQFEIAAGAGFVIPIAGSIVRMPGLPKQPAAIHMDVDPQGQIRGLF